MRYFHDLIADHPRVLTFWVFVVGSVIGSFLNVVIYRLPRGMSLSRPGSHCPMCGHAIRWYHNLPIVGWFLLRGKCHDCKAAISPRYPLVELAVAVVVTSLWHFDVVSYLAIAVERAQAAGETTSLDSELGRGLVAFTAHAWLECSLIAAALIFWDGNRVAWTLVVLSLIVAAVAAPFLDPFRAGWLFLCAGLLVGVALLQRRKRKPPASAGGS